jgi:hypothetical protein
MALVQSAHGGNETQALAGAPNAAAEGLHLFRGRYDLHGNVRA